MLSVRESFQSLDYLVFSLVLLVSCGIGVYHCWRGKGQDQDGYLMGNRQMNCLTVALSLIASFYSGVSQLGKTAEVFLNGIQYSLTFFGNCAAMIITAYTFMPLFYKLKVTSLYEYLELRFDSKAVRRVAALNNICAQIMYCGLATYAPSIALEAVTEFPMWASILCVGGVASFYTMLGGLKAVVWADTFQILVMTGGFLCIAIFGLFKVGGLTETLAENIAGGRINNISFDPNPLIRMSFWSVAIGSVFSYMPMYAVNQTCVQRCLSVPRLKQARMALWMNIILHFIMDALVYSIGLLIYSYFSSCDPLNHPDPEQRISSPNQLLPLFVMKVVHMPGVPGLFLASLFSGSLSTVSSCLNAIATVTWEDFFKLKFDDLAETTKTNILKLMVLIYGVTSIGVAFLASFLRGSILQVGLSFLDTSASPLMGIFILGTFFTGTNWLGSIIGCLLGFIFPMWISLGSYLAVPETPPLNTSIADCVWNETASFNFSGIISSVNNEPIQGLKKLYTVSFLWFPFIGTMTTVVVGLVASAVTGPFVQSVAPTNIKDSHIIFPLDFWSHRKKTRSGKNEELDNEELKELTT